MSRLHYMSLPGVGAWEAVIKEAGGQLAPYRSYLATARMAAERRALVLSWRRPSRDELAALDARQADQHQGKASRASSAPRRRDRRAPRALAEGTWVMLEPPPGRAEEPESTFEAFLRERAVYERAQWSDAHAIRIEDTDEEARALLLTRAPDPIPPPEDATAALRQHGPLLYLRPNTWPLECQRRAVERLENEPNPRLAPLLRLCSTRPSWARNLPDSLQESAWVFLKREPRGGLRDGTAEQRDFVERALATPDFALLEGPPGSGKTTAICELIAQVARRGERVLLVASTHVAVDNVLERLLAWQDTPSPPGDPPREKLVLPVRIGEERNVTSEAVAAWTLGHLERTWRAEILDHLERPQDASPQGGAARALLKEAMLRKGEENGLIRLLLESSNLVCGTTIGILQHPAIKARGPVEPFDLMILDEASKTTFAEFLVPASFARRWVVVGDIRQLSPYVDELDLAENLRGLLPADLALATAHAALVSDAVRPGDRVPTLFCARTAAEADLLAGEARARGVHAVDLNRTAPVALRGAPGALPGLLYADLVFGSARKIAAFEHRLPGDLIATSGPLPPLPDWEAHRDARARRDGRFRRALRDRREEPVDWAREVAWRQVRGYELRQNPEDQARLLGELDALIPATLDEAYFQFRKLRPRTRRDGENESPRDLLNADLANMRQVAMPSILEILQRGAGALGWDRETALTHGLPGSARADRLVSLGFQHRMHPDISAFPRAEFYAEAGLLQDAAGMASARAWGYPRYARRAVWVEIQPREQGRARSSNVNETEAEALLEELSAFAAWAAEHPRPGGGPWEVAVLTFYRGQEAELRHRLRRASGLHGNSRNFRLPRGRADVHVTLCTVDRFQGHEADLVLLSFVKTHGAVGFLNSPNRLNVALTRARFQLVLVGHRAGFASDRCRSALLQRLASSDAYAHDLAWGSP